MSDTDFFGDPRRLAAALGSFWTEISTARHQVLSLVACRAMLDRQSTRQAEELLASLARETTPTTKLEDWWLLRVRRSELLRGEHSLGLYDEGYVYDGALQYDVSAGLRDLPVASPRYAIGDDTALTTSLATTRLGASQRYGVPRPEGLRSLALVANRLTAPSVVWTAGTDVWLTDRAIAFSRNPFELAFATAPVLEDGQEVDQEAWLWLWRSAWDEQTIRRQYGYVLRIPHHPSPSYRDLVNAAFDTLFDGGSRQAILRGLSAVSGIPLAAGRETVERISTDHQGLAIVTDRNVYRFSRDAVPAVAVGDTVRKHQSLITGFELIEFRGGRVPESLTSMVFGAGFVSPCYSGGLVFANEDVPLVVTTDARGFTRVSFEIHGHPADVEAFFDDMHARGIAEADRPIGDCDDVETLAASDGTRYRSGTLAHMLDLRRAAGAERIGEPTAEQLPATINPLEFLAQNFLRYNTCLARIRPGDAATPGLPLTMLRFVRAGMPAHTAMLILVELTMETETVSGTNVVTDELDTFAAAGPLTESVGSESVSESLTAWLVRL